MPCQLACDTGADSLAGDKLGAFNLSMRGHAECLRFVPFFGLPMLVLGGGGYKISNVSRCWAYETGVILGQPPSWLLPPALMPLPPCLFRMRHKLNCTVSSAPLPDPCSTTFLIPGPLHDNNNCRLEKFHAMLCYHDAGVRCLSCDSSYYGAAMFVTLSCIIASDQLALPNSISCYNMWG